MHNWNIANGWTEGEVLAHGRAVAQLSSPLFPAYPALEAVNARLLAAAVELTGSGSREEMERPYRADRDSIWGSGVMAVQQQPDGSYGVDVTPIEEACNTLFGGLQHLQSQVNGIK